VSNFVEAVVDNDPQALEAQIMEVIEAQFEDLEWPEGALETWLVKAFARLASVNRQQAAQISKDAFKRFGESIVGVPPITPASAAVASTWTMADAAGYTIPAGTLVSIAAAGDEAFGFRTVGDVTVAPGDTATAAGEVVLLAVEPGEAANGLSADPVLSDSLNFVDSIALNGVTANGADAEDEDAYLTRLTEQLQLLSLSLIVPRDFEIDARAVPGVFRAVCIPGYNGATKEADQPLCVSVAAIDENGAKLEAPAKAVLLARQAAKVPSGVENFVIDPDYTGIDVALKHTTFAGYDPAVVSATAKAALTAYLASANWGLPVGFGDPGNSAGWELLDAVYRNELIAIADRVPGLDRVVELKLAEEGDPLLTQESVALAGVAPLTKPGTIEAVAV